MGTRKLGLRVLITAIISRLNSHASTSSYKNYNYIKPDEAMPYNHITGAMGGRSSSFGSKDTEAEDNSIHIHTWSDYKGDKEVLTMQDNIIQAIDSSPLTITGYDSPCLALLELANVLDDDTDPNNIKKHGIIRFSFQMAPSD